MFWKRKWQLLPQFSVIAGANNSSYVVVCFEVVSYGVSCFLFGGFFCADRTTVENGAEGGFVLGCFFGLGLVASAGCVPKRRIKTWKDLKRRKKTRKLRIVLVAAK